MGAARRAPVRAWLRPALILVGGLAAAVVLWLLADRIAVGVAAALFALFLAYWTSPLRAGPHTPMSAALTQRGDEVAIILWAPGDPLSSRMQAAIRSPREDVVWVNVHQDPRAAQFLDEHGGRTALPLVVVGDHTAPSATVGDLLDMQTAGRERAAQDLPPQDRPGEE